MIYENPYVRYDDSDYESDAWLEWEAERQWAEENADDLRDYELDMQNYESSKDF